MSNYLSAPPWTGLIFHPARDAAIDDLIKSVGLEDQRQVKAGNDFTRGLSGGNKRRLSIAVALAKRPSVLFSASPESRALRA